jgi:hypothetical protein
MKQTFRGLNRVQVTFLPEPEQYIDLAEADPEIFTPLDLQNVTNKAIDRGLQDVPLFYRGDTVTLEATLLDFRGNPFPNLATAVSIQMAVKKLVPTRQVLFILTGAVIDAAVGRVDFVLTPTQTNQADVDEAICNPRVEYAPGLYITFETTPVNFRDSAFTL